MGQDNVKVKSGCIKKPSIGQEIRLTKYLVSFDENERVVLEVCEKHNGTTFGIRPTCPNEQGLYDGRFEFSEGDELSLFKWYLTGRAIAEAAEYASKKYGLGYFDKETEACKCNKPKINNEREVSLLLEFIEHIHDNRIPISLFLEDKNNRDLTREFIKAFDKTRI